MPDPSPRVSGRAILEVVLRGDAADSDRERTRLEGPDIIAASYVTLPRAAGMAMLLLERSGLAKLRGDTDNMKRDLAEARRLFAEMGVTGWNDYARSIEA